MSDASDRPRTGATDTGSALDTKGDEMRLVIRLLVVVVALAWAGTAEAEQRYSGAAGDSGSVPHVAAVVTNDAGKVPNRRISEH